MKKSYIASTTCIVLLLLAMGVAGRLVISSYTLGGYAGNVEAKVILLLSPDADSTQVADICRKLKSDAGVEKFEYLDSSDASHRLEKMTGFADDSVGRSTTLPALFEITLTNAKTASELAKSNTETASAWAKSGAKLQGVRGTYTIRNAPEPNVTITTISQNMKSMGIMLLCALTLALYFVIHLSVKAAVKEIRTMQLVGARNSFIKRPFIRRAVFQGFIAALLASVLMLLLTLINGEGEIVEMEYLKTSAVIVSTFCVVGVILCTICTAIALGVIMRRK